ncbi:MAG: serine hydrolase [Pseudomonadota bacterium]|nr:serine hydrolase [Pseudomonadota bacterium]
MAASLDRRRLALTAASAALGGGLARTALAQPAGAAVSPAIAEVLAYAQAQATTGLLVVQNRRVIVERNWPLPPSAAQFERMMVHGRSADGALKEDVASQQKSFISVLAGIAIDKGLLDIEKPISAYIGAGWSKASPEQETAITVHHLLEMNSGLRTNFTYEAPPGTKFLYNTEVYATMKPVLAAASHLTLDQFTAAWLTTPLGMSDTSWQKRPGGVMDANPTGLVTTPRDAAKMGQMVLDGGRAADGKSVISERQLQAMFQRSVTNPSYGRLWWLNGGAFAIRPGGARQDGQLIPAAPTDLVAALGAADRKLYIVPSRKIIVVRMGQQAPDKGFDEQLWVRLMAALPA